MMITCPECKKEYSDQSKNCVHCGARNPNKMSAGGKIGVFLLIVVGLFVALLIFGNMAYDPEQHSAELAIEECRKSENDALLSIEARRIARGACELLEQRYKDKYGHAP
jgi:hypothetical protein